MNKKNVYFFGKDASEGKKEMKELLGGKGANLAEMASIGLPVPPGFTITTEVCIYYSNNNGKYPEGLSAEVSENMKKLESFIGRKFGSKENPLLVSVRSGAPISMPGMMDTILNLGLNDETVKGLADLTNDERFAYDSYRRFIQMYGNVVLKIEHEKFENIMKSIKTEKNVTLDLDLNAEDLKRLVKEYKELILREIGDEFPMDVNKQLWGAINAVFESWNNERAKEYRRIEGISDTLGTAVNVQTMVYGNMGEDSATGVAFTRNPSNGDNHFYGEYLINAQGEDVVAGIRTPQPINEFSKTSSEQKTLEELMPESYKELFEIRNKLEKHYKDMQDLEFTIERGKLWMLQTRTGKRTPLAAIKIAVDMVNEGIIDKKTGILRVKPSDIDGMLHPMIDPNESIEILSKGLPASPGAASGRIVLTAKEAVEKYNKKEMDLILLREETSPEDISGMDVCNGILTARGGMTSHAAVVARGMGKPCVVGCSDIEIDLEKRIVNINGKVLKDGDYITIDGTTGNVIEGQVKMIKPELKDEFEVLMEWTEEFKRLEIRTNADTPTDAEMARKFGAKGIGLCRTEHMFFGEKRIEAVREMILANDNEGRERALQKILPMQRDDFEGIFKVMDGYPVVIRTLDPPLHEFLPKDEEQIKILAGKMGISVSKLKQKIDELYEVNPMLGHRGCRLGITYPEITKMQVRAIMEAACNMTKKGIKVIPEIMIPLVGNVKELKEQKRIVIETAKKVMEEKGIEIEYLIGTMIELPRAALTASEIAKEAEFFSFGTNDLTQTTLGFSRDDVGPILKTYMEKQILKDDPFATLDQEGVGRLIRIAIEDGKKANPELEIGICGEHGGDPKSIEFFNKNGFDYVSCSPYRVPVARLSAAQAEINKNKE